jgi:hypothetical protein
MTTPVEQVINTILETRLPRKINDTFVDIFTASMIKTVANNLTEENRQKLYTMPIHKMVAVSITMLKS